MEKEGIHIHFGIILDLLIMVCGIYVVYQAIRMKSTNQIPEMLVGKDFPIERAKDSAGFIRFTFPYTTAIGIVLLTTGLAGALDILVGYPLAKNVMRVVLVIGVTAYGVMLIQAQKKYLVGC